MPTLNLIGNFQDSINKISGENRKYVFNRGEFNAKSETWNADLIEIIDVPVEIPPPEPPTDPTEYPSFGHRALYNWYAVNGIT